jgi:apolipoprotein N-acyltransferase
VENKFVILYIIIQVSALIYFASLKAKNPSFLKNIAIIFGCGVVSSAFPWLTFGMLAGLPSVVIMTLFMSLIFMKELGGKNERSNKDV